MKLPAGLNTKKRSRADIEHEAAQELEAAVRGGQTPPPADWSLLPPTGPTEVAEAEEAPGPQD